MRDTRGPDEAYIAQAFGNWAAVPWRAADGLSPQPTAAFLTLLHPLVRQVAAHGPGFAQQYDYAYPSGVSLHRYDVQH